MGKQAANKVFRLITDKQRVQNKESDISDEDEAETGTKRTRSLTTTPEITPDFINDRRRNKKKDKQKTLPVQGVAFALEELDRMEMRLSLSNNG